MKVFDELLERIRDATSYENLKQAREALEQIKGTVATIGTGGSYPIALFLEKVLTEKNGCFVKAMKPRDLLYDKSIYDNILAFTYSGKTPSVIQALESKKGVKTVFTHNANKLKENINILDNYQIIDYSGKTEKEKSFISIASTLAPICLLAKYYDDDIDIEQVFMSVKEYVDKLIIEFNNKIEILSGDYTTVAAYILESALIESGLAYTIIHEKNDFCHGRSILNYRNHTDLILYLINGNLIEQDRVLLDYINEFSNNIVTICSKESGIYGELELAFISMFLLKKIAEYKDIDLAKIDYPIQLKKIYYFNGGM